MSEQNYYYRPPFLYILLLFITVNFKASQILPFFSGFSSILYYIYVVLKDVPLWTQVGWRIGTCQMGNCELGLSENNDDISYVFARNTMTVVVMQNG